MNLTKQEFDRLKIPANYVLVKPHVNDGIYKLQSGHEIIITVDPNQVEHFSVTAEVIRLPEKLVFNGDNKNMHWRTVIELDIGDVVWCNYFSLMDAMGKLELAEENILTCEGEQYVFIKYSEIYVAKRDDDIIPINGYALIEPVFDYYSTTNIIIPDHLAKKDSHFIGTIKHMAFPNEYYYGEDRPFYKKTPGDETIYEELDIDYLVVVRQHKNIYLEREGYESLSGSDRFWRVQYRDLLGLLETDRVGVSTYKPKINTTRKVKK